MGYCWCQAYALLYDSVNKEDLTIRIGAIVGLGLAYAGSQKEEVGQLLSNISLMIGCCMNMRQSDVIVYRLQITDY